METTFVELISIAGYGIEAIGVLVIILGSLVASYRFLTALHKYTSENGYPVFRQQLGRSIILGLEFLIAGDIIRTVVVADTLANIAALGLIIVIRTFLSMTLHLEVEGCWPWQESARNDANQH